MHETEAPHAVTSRSPGAGLCRSIALGLACLLAACSAESGAIDDRGRGRGAGPEIISRPPAGGIAGSGSIPGPGTTTVPVAPQTPVAGAGGSPASCAAISQRAENQRRPADIIVAVDNSGSMSEEIGFVRDRMNAFSQQIVASGVDVRIILVSAPFGGMRPPESFFDDDDDEDLGICIAAPLGSGSCPDDSKAPGYFHVPTEVGSHDALNLFIETFPRWQSQLRPSATKSFVVVTDDNAEDEPNDSAAAFRQSVAALPGGLFASWSLSGIFCFSDCPDAAEIGSVYQDLVAQTQGVAGDLCQQDFAPVFDALAKAVIQSSGLDCAWDIPAAPAGQTFDRQQVNVQYSTQGAATASLLQVTNAAACGTRSGWHYDDPANPKQILVCPATCSALQGDLTAKVDVLFGCDTQLAPE